MQARNDGWGRFAGMLGLSPDCDENAIIEAFLQRFSKLIRSIAARRGFLSIVDDVLQEVTLRVIKQLVGSNEQFFKSDLREYVGEVARNLCSDLYRQSCSRRLVLISDEDIRKIIDKKFERTAPEEIERKDILRRRMNEALEEQPEPGKSVIKDKIAGKTTEDIARDIGKSENAVKLILSRTIRSIREQLRKDGLS